MNLPMRLSVHTEQWRFSQPFRIAGHCYTSREFVIVELSTDKACGRGEAWCIYFCDETISSITQQIESVAEQIENGISREQLLELLPPGGARNAIDCALWDLEAKHFGKTIWELTGITPKSITTALTIGLEETPDAMAMSALKAKNYPILKIKLDSDQPVQRVAAVRAARPDARLAVDANQAWSYEQLVEISPELVKLGVEMIEQPLKRGCDDELEGYVPLIPLCADESCLDRSELKQVSKRYQIVNIKLDKTGGLTEALLLAKAAKKMGLELMVGNMGGTSLCIAPALVVAQLCKFHDLDGPLILKYDRFPSINYKDSEILISETDKILWG